MDLQCTSTKQADALAAVIGERSHQDRQWGDIDQRPREVGTYLTLMRKKLADAEAAFCDSDNDHDALDNLRKVVALGVACFEQHGVPSRMVPAAAKAPAASPYKRNPKLAGYDNKEVTGMWDTLIDKSLTAMEVITGPLRGTITYDELYEEMMARDLGPIPF